jgi:hypothetical protein
LQTAVEEEIGFLARKALQAPEVRRLLWSWILRNLPQKGLRAAGVKDDVLLNAVTTVLKEGLRVPSGGGGGGDAGTGDNDPSGGGGEPVKPDDFMKVNPKPIPG